MTQTALTPSVLKSGYVRTGVSTLTRRSLQLIRQANIDAAKTDNHFLFNT